jgi:hypothetical protein
VLLILGFIGDSMTNGPVAFACNPRNSAESNEWKVGRVIIKPEISLAWQHEFGDQSYAIISSFAKPRALT